MLIFFIQKTIFFKNGYLQLVLSVNFMTPIPPFGYDNKQRLGLNKSLFLMSGIYYV